MKNKIIIKGIIIIILLFYSNLMVTSNVNAKEGATKITRIKEIKQNIDGKEVYIRCSFKECISNKSGKFSEKPCSAGSDLRNIYAKTKSGKWKTLEELKFKNIQGGCINGDKMIIAFVDKNRHKKGDLTAFVEINLVENKVIKVTMVEGAKDLNIKSFGHSNDFTYLNGNYFGSWYQKNGKKNYTSRIGKINTNLSGKGTIGDFSKGSKGKAAFGITSYMKKNELALGIRESVKKDGKSHTERYVSLYGVKINKKGKAKYELNKKMFDLKKNSKYPTPQCMEQVNKKFYVVRFNKKVGKINNCIELINSNGKKEKQYNIKNPNIVTLNKENENEKKSKRLKMFQWEIESLDYYKKNTFYYTMYKPSDDDKIGKQAYLYKVKLK